MDWIVWVLLGALALVFVVLGIALQLNHTRKEGYNAGYHAGYDAGYDEGNDDGYLRGEAEGYDKGYDEGYNAAKNGNTHQWQN